MDFLKNSLLIAWLILFLISPLYAADLFYDTGDDDTANERNLTYHIGDNIDLITTKRIFYEKPKIVISAIYPQLDSFMNTELAEQFNQLVNDIIQFEIADFKYKVVAQQNVQAMMPRANIKNNLFIDYNASYIQSGNENLLSVRFSLQGTISGLAHPFHYHRVLNYNLSTNQILGLSDLFNPDVDYLTFLANYAQAGLSKHSSKTIIAEGAPKSENFKNWNLKPNGLQITFDEFHTAARDLGTQSIIIPYGSLRPISFQASPIQSCVERPTRCRRNNLLINGFVD